jgi:hypothetical protein
MASAVEWKALMDAGYWLPAVQKEEKNYPYPTSITVNYDIYQDIKGMNFLKVYSLFLFHLHETL